MAARWVIPVLLLSLLQSPTFAVPDIVTSCPSTTCTSCPSASSLSDVLAGKFPGAMPGQYRAHVALSTNKPSTVVSTSLKTTIDTCCVSCTSSADCHFFSWQSVSGEFNRLSVMFYISQVSFFRAKNSMFLLCFYHVRIFVRFEFPMTSADTETSYICRYLYTLQH